MAIACWWNAAFRSRNYKRHIHILPVIVYLGRGYIFKKLIQLETRHLPAAPLSVPTYQWILELADQARWMMAKAYSWSYSYTNGIPVGDGVRNSTISDARAREVMVTPSEDEIGAERDETRNCGEEVWRCDPVRWDNIDCPFLISLK